MSTFALPPARPHWAERFEALDMLPHTGDASHAAEGLHQMIRY
jgi:hypothetical protein